MVAHLATESLEVAGKYKDCESGGDHTVEWQLGAEPLKTQE